MFKIKLFVVILALFNLTSANMYDHKDVVPTFGLQSIQNFINAYWAACEKFKHRRYKKILKSRREPGPLIYAGDHFVRGNNAVYDGWNALVSFLETWDPDTFWKIFATSSAYGLIPFIGGYMRA